MAYYRQIESSWNEFQDVVMQVSEKLQKALSKLDKVIQQQVKREAIPERPRESEQFPTPSILELQKRNSSLNHEVEYYLQLEQARNEFQDVVTKASDKLQNALSKFGKVRQQVNYEKRQISQGSRADVQKDL